MYSPTPSFKKVALIGHKLPACGHGLGCGMLVTHMLPHNTRSRYEISRNSKSISFRAQHSSERSYLTCPMVIETVEKLSEQEVVPIPVFGNWAGSLGGMWIGYKGVYAPFTGEAEPVALDGKKKLYHVMQCCVEEKSMDDDGLACVVRHEASASNDSELKEYIKDAGALDFARNEDTWEHDVLRNGEHGLFTFDGGSYSRVPLQLVDLNAYNDTINDSDEEYRVTDNVSVIEGCLQWNGEQRVRIMVTLSCDVWASEDPEKDSPELDVSLMRISMCREDWEGMPGQYTSDSQSDSDAQGMMVSGETRIDSREELAGFWNDFSIDAFMIEDIDMKTGEMATMPMYLSQETQQCYHVGDHQTEFLGSGCAVDGGTLWLPHRVILQVSSPISDEDDVGLELRMLWSPCPGKTLSLITRYSRIGQLLGSTCSSAIKVSDK